MSIHDPSVVCKDGNFYIWGSHLGIASSKDLQTFNSLTAGSNTFRRLTEQGSKSSTACTFSDAFNTQQVTQVKNAKGETVPMPNFDAEAYCARYASTPSTWVNGVMWAPDIIWNEHMQKWCLYMSLNGDYWSSIIILLTSNNATGPFTYQGPIVMGGFDGQTHRDIAAPTYADTDMEIALGEELTATPSRYIQTDNGKYWPNCIDPCVFFDEEGELWMSYGSWSGGIFLLRLDKETGLRDYTYTYESDYASKGASGVSDPYFGKKIAGGYYVSGEGSYIQHIGNHYYLFMSYGGFAPDGGYDMRIFRSEKPEGPYKDANGNLATYTSYQLNFGPGAVTNRGMHLMGAYNEWGGLQNVGECAQGHNSACQDEEGRTFVVYHTKFNDGTAGHQVRVHQLFLNQNGWPVAAPFCYRGETQTDGTIASTQTWTKEELTGEYSVLLHPYKLNHSEYEEIIPSTLTLNADGSVTGKLTGTWGLTEGTSYMWIKLGSVTYYGVFCEQQINGSTTANYQTSTLEAIAFTSTATSGTPLWGYKLKPQHAIAWNQQNNTLGVKDGQTVSSNLSLMFPTDNNVTLSWTSSQPDVISETGKYAPLSTATDVTLTARLSCGDYYWEQAYNVTAQKEIIPSGDYLSGIVAYYDFDEKPTINHYKPSTETQYDKASYGKFGSGTAPTLEEDYDRFGHVVHLTFGANGSNSYVRMPNPLYGQAELEGFTVSAWVKRGDDNAWDALWGFWGNTSYTGSNIARLFLTGNSYIGYNDANDTWFDINHPNDGVYSDIPVGEWALVTVSVGPANGVRIYINGIGKSAHTIADSNGATTLRKLPVSEVTDKVSALRYFYLGNGSFWGSADCCIDDLIIYNRELSAADIRALNSMSNRVTDFTIGENGTAVDSPISTESRQRSRYTGTYDLTGRRLSNGPIKSGIYIKNGKKIIY